MAIGIASVLRYHKYLGRDSQTVYNSQYYCGECRQRLHDPYHFPENPERLEAENETDYGVSRFGPRNEALMHFLYCPWCGVEFEDKWWKEQPIQNERAIDHYRDPGTHKGDRHEFRGEGPDCMANHWLAVSGGDKVCWCDPEVEPGIMGCVIRHQDKNYEDWVGSGRAKASEDDDWDEYDET